jgi:hypothetical protein
MRAKTDQFQRTHIRFAVDEDQVGPDVAVAAVPPLPTEWMVAVTGRKHLIDHEKSHDLQYRSVEPPNCLPRFPGHLAFEVSLKLIGVPNRPHEDDVADRLGWPLS